MAKNLLQKLNTLIQAKVHDVLDTAANPIRQRLGRGSDLDQEVAELRQQIAAAEVEDQAMRQQQATLSNLILRLDEQADAAVSAGRDQEARRLLEQIQTEKQRLAMLTSDIDDQRRAMSDLLRQINELEALVEVAKRAEAEPEAQETQSSEPTLSEAIRQARQQVQTEAAASKIEVINSTPLENTESQSEPQSEASIEQELAVRRARLAKPDQ